MPITAATFQSYRQVGPRIYAVTVNLTHSVKPPYQGIYTATGTTAAQLRDDVSRQIADENDAEAVGAVLAGISVGFNIPVTRPATPTPPAPTAQHVWLERAARLVRVKALVEAGASTLTDELAALATQVNADFQAGYFDAI
jgi:hypothetical protein